MGEEDLKPTKHCQIICEGSSDKEFFDRLLMHHQITDYEVSHPKSPGPTGRSGFGKQLGVFVKVFPGVARLIVLASDSDDDAAQSFAYVQGQIEDVGLNAPPIPHTVEWSNGRIALAVLMVPGGNRLGNLETVLYEAACDRIAGGRACVEEFQRCVGADDWGPSKEGKMRMAALTAGYYKDNPSAPPTWIWREPSLLDIASPRFTPYAEHLRRFVNELTARA
jgi:hypothetical protein